MVNTQEKHEFVDKFNIKRKALAILETTGNLKLTGHTGVGKTKLVQWLADKEGWILYQRGLDEDASRYDLLASDTLENGSTQVREGIVLKWLRDNTPGKKKVLYIDDISSVGSTVLSMFFSLTDQRKGVWIPEIGEFLTRSEDHWMIIAYNPSEKAAYTHTFTLTTALIRRFEGLTLDYLDVLSETQLLKKYYGDYDYVRRLTEFAKKIRDNFKVGRLNGVITTGNLINYCKLKEYGLSDEEVLDIALNQFSMDERVAVSRMWAGENKKNNHRRK